MKILSILQSHCKLKHGNILYFIDRTLHLLIRQKLLSSSSLVLMLVKLTKSEQEAESKFYFYDARKVSASGSASSSTGLRTNLIWHIKPRYEQNNILSNYKRSMLIICMKMKPHTLAGSQWILFSPMTQFASLAQWRCDCWLVQTWPGTHHLWLVSSLTSL